jgi:exodeoxyribonuclease VII small subunit
VVSSAQPQAPRDEEREARLETAAGTLEAMTDSPTDVAQQDVSQLSYEQARDELVRVVSELEQGSVTLEQSLALWERGEALARRCEEWLLGAKARLDAARAAATGDGQSAARAAASEASTAEVAES